MSIRAGDESLVIAVDGGGAKTDLALLDAGGRLLAHVRGPGSQAHHLGVDGCVAVLEGLLTSAAADAGLDPRARPLAATAQLLIAGIDVPRELAALAQAMRGRRWSERLSIGNDTEALLRAGTDRGWGVAVVCGTGINCLGRAQDGSEARFLSFGDISGDWGGGTDVGIAALAAAVRSADGRGPQTALQDAVPAHFGRDHPFAVAEAVQLGELPVGRLGELFATVLTLAGNGLAPGGATGGDAAAAAIVDRLVDEVGAFIEAAVRRLGLAGADPDIVLGGRLLRTATPDLVARIAARLHASAPAARVLVSRSEPIVGAALLGLDALAARVDGDRGGRADADAAARVRAELDVAVVRR